MAPETLKSILFMVNPPRPLLAVPNITAHPSTASVPITVYCCIMVRCFAV